MISKRVLIPAGNEFFGLPSRVAFLRQALVLAALLLAIALPGRAQLLSVNNSNMVPQPGAGHDYIHMLSETVDPANGSVSIRINLPLPPGRGITLPFSIAYDSQGTFSPAQYGPIIISVGDYLSQGGWSYAIPRFGIQFSSFTGGWPTLPRHQERFSF